MELDLEAIGYPVVREAFNDVLQLCVERLGKTELMLVEEVLGLADTGGIFPDAAEMLADTALYSAKQTSGSHPGSRSSVIRW